MAHGPGAARRLVVFDLDGTITARDTLLPYALGFLRASGRSRLRLLRLLPTLAAFLLGLADRGRLKAALIRATLGGATRQQVEDWNRRFLDSSPARPLPAAGAAIRRHLDAGDVLVLMSASPDLYVPEIGRKLGFSTTVCTGVAWRNGTVEGALSTPNRRGGEKVRCLRELQARHPGAATVAYGNAKSDLAHLRLADEPRLENAAAGTRRAAARAGLRPYAEWR